jgi:dihydrofolate reductase
LIKAIFACDNNWGIGKNNALPWPHNSADLNWFKETTIGGVVAMGKTTWDSLPEKSKPLPNRNNIVVTSSLKDKNGPYHFVKFENAKDLFISMSKLQTVWIIGGAQLFESCIDVIEELWLSRIDGIYDCDTFLPDNLILEKFELYERYFDGSLTTEKYRKKNNERIPSSTRTCVEQRSC